MYKLSICIPVYGVEPYIERCARSLFEQTLENIEYIFVDDCTKDRSMDIVRGVLNEYPMRTSHVVVVRHATNMGRAAARRTGTLAATGEWVVHCDPDDWVDADYYEQLVTAAETQGADMAYGFICREYSNGNTSLISSKKFDNGKEMTAELCPGEMFNSTVNKIVRRSIVQNDAIVWPSRMNIGEDLLLMAQVIPACGRIVCCSDVIYHYRSNSSSVTSCGDSLARYHDLGYVADVLVPILHAPLYGDVRDRLRRDALCAMLRARIFNGIQWRKYRCALETPLCAEKRYGLAKRVVLWLADCLLSRK